jgi:hypothetical protein
MTLRNLWILGVLGMATACATTEPLEGPIDYEMTGGFSGSGDASAVLHIELDGEMTRTPRGGAPEVTQLSASAMESLRAKIEAADFPSLAPEYTYGADDYTHVVSVSVAGAVHSVRADESAEKPAALEAALDALHDLATD